MAESASSERVPFMITERIERTIRIAELRLRPLEAPLSYQPGQYVLVGNEQMPSVRARPYSIANAPRADGEITLLVTRQPGGSISTWLHEWAWPGRELFVSGPHGSFVAGPSMDAPTLCLAAGSGLAPILALIDAALQQGCTEPITLLFSARAADELYCQGTLAYWQRRHPSFRSLTTLTQSATGDGLHGRIPEILPKQWADLEGHNVFIAGSVPFVEACAAAVRALGAPAERLHTEAYVDQVDDGRHIDLTGTVDVDPVGALAASGR